jgi:hypothetical protein
VNEPAELARRIVAEGGALHPDVAPRGLAYGLVVVCPNEELDRDIKLAHVAVALYFTKERMSPLLETSRQRLWARVQDALRERWVSAGSRALDLGDAWNPLDEVWKANRDGERLVEFPRALKKLRSAMLKSFGEAKP